MIPGIVAGTPVVKLWTPADLPVAPHIWADWDSDVTDVSGDASAWSNSKGSIGGSFTSGSGVRPQILAAELGGKRVLRFDPTTSDRMLLTSSAAGDLFRNTGAGWGFMVVKKRGTDGAGTSRVAFYAPQNSAATRFQMAVGATAATNVNQLAARRLDSDTTAMLNGTATPGAWTIRADFMDWSAGDGFIYLNGSLDSSNLSLTTSGSTSNTAGSDTRVSLGGTSSSTPSGFADIDLACILVGAGSLPSTDDRQRIEGWAAWQLGLEGNLPIGHPYKDDPPIA